MRSILSALLAVVFATTAYAQFGENPKIEVQPEARKTEKKNANEEKNVGPVEPANPAPAAAVPNAMFTAIDADSDGVITKAELRKAIVALKTLDTDKDGNITLAEVGGGAAPGVGDPAQMRIDQMIAQYDRDGNGMLTANELPRDMVAMLQNADTNNDKAIDRTELAAAMQNVPNQFQNPPGGNAPGPGNQVNDEMTGQFIKQYDQDNDGRISSRELPPRLRQSFQAGDDANKDGFIDAGEMQVVMARMGGGARAWAAGANPTGQQNTFRDPNRRSRPQPPQN